MIGWLVDRAEACAGPVASRGGGQVWNCQQDDAPGRLDRTAYRVTLELTPPGSLDIKAVVDQSRDASPDVNRARGFLADGIAGSPAIGSAGPLLTSWVVANLDKGGQTTVGPVTAVLSPFGRVTEVHLSVNAAATPSPPR